ncbi:hypothetical protein N008_00075 [Hymenobacter sp. APR13]|nr:hypothetical protein N008_00075 [Hymenobacter sp. APR13]
MNILQRNNLKSLNTLLVTCENKQTTVDANFTVYNDNTYCLNVWYMDGYSSEVESYESLPDNLVLHITEAYKAQHWKNDMEGTSGCYYDLKRNQIFILKAKIDELLNHYYTQLRVK